MCNPVLAAVAVGGLTTVAQHSAASNAAAAEAQHNSNLMRYRNQKVLNEMDHQRQKYAEMQETYYRVGTAARANAQAQYQDTMRNIDQTVAATYGRIKQFSRTTDKNQSSLKQAAAEGNVGGLSLHEALTEFEVLEASNSLNEKTNLKNYITQQYRQMDAIQANAQMQANQATPQPLAPIAPPQPVPTVVGPSLLASLASGIASGVSVYGAAGGFTPNQNPSILGGGPNTSPVTVGGATYPAYSYMPNLSGQ